jgi:MinD-like ATPase involved in chromosome partitioning or flagellar assembly
MSRIITFYSYKGGVGRTSAMANVAVLLAKQDKSVLLMDWDLEAPGLDRFFSAYARSAKSDRPGLIHLLSQALQGSTPDWNSYVSEIEIEGCRPISIIPSGDALPDYVERVRRFSWPDFFERHGGGAILDRWRDEWKSTYDFVLIDSRTGITDLGGVCTIFLPDILVLVFTANDQSFEGALQVAKGIQVSRRDLAVPRPQLAILPLLGRFDARDEVDTADEWLDRFSRDLEPFYSDWLPKQIKPRRIIELTKIPYITKFSFGEPLAVLEHSVSDPEFPGFYLKNVARLIASDFSEAQQIVAPESIMFRQSQKISDTIKKLLANPSERVRLHDFVSELLRETARRLDQQNFSTSGSVTSEEFAARIQRYEETISELLTATVLLARWASADQIYLLETIFERVAEFDKPGAGVVVWLRLSWYPILVLMYGAGIAALAGRNYPGLRAALLTPVYTRLPLLNKEKAPIVLPTVLELTEIVGQFNSLPGMSQRRVPRSDHLYEILQPVMEDQFFLGRQYEELFDEFEVILALTFADLRDDDPRQHVWGPPGRFAWKERGLFSQNPVFTRYVNQVEARGQDWDLLKFGFFRGTAERFAAVAEAYKQLLGQVNWW